MKLLHTICAALMMVAITSCDEHREFPDTAMKTCDILCTDGKVVRYEDMKSQGKQPIAVVFHINQNNETQGTASKQATNCCMTIQVTQISAIKTSMPSSTDILVPLMS